MLRSTFLHHFPSRKFGDVGPDFVICRGSGLLGRCFVVAIVNEVVVAAASLTKEKRGGSAGEINL